MPYNFLAARTNCAGLGGGGGKHLLNVLTCYFGVANLGIPSPVLVWCFLPSFEQLGFFPGVFCGFFHKI